MSELWRMFQLGAGVGAWVAGLALVVAIMLPVFGILMAVIARVLRGGAPPRADGGKAGKGGER